MDIGIGLRAGRVALALFGTVKVGIPVLSTKYTLSYARLPLDCPHRTEPLGEN
jgi:hypothetical protein